jgi:lipoprotein-anchoring transpeptidase ErfK/SrfK
MNSVNGSRCSAAPTRLWQVAILTAAGAIGTASQAEAAFYYYSDYPDGAYGRQVRHLEEPRLKPQKRGSAVKNKKEARVEKETGAKPQGPLVIVVSIERQKVTIYDSNGVFAESPVSTGMKGHSTPMGVFSVIQKHKFHHSNIYSGAPMPYMQRITWSGIAMHAGVLPGYPASHGCIRMPMAFAVKMWNWTKMGARVIVTPGQMTPQNFSHPMLASLRVPPQPAASLEPPTSVGDKADKGAPETTKVTEVKPTEAKSFETKTASAESVLELRSTVGHSVMSDVTTGNAPIREEAANSEAKTDTRSAEASEPAKQPEAAAKPADGAGAEAKPAEAAEAPKAASDGKPAGKVEAAKSESSDALKADAPKAEVAAEPVKADAAPTQTKPDAAATAAAPSDLPDAKKDQTRVADPAPSVKPDLPKRTGQIAVFISRKDSKLYVRQNFAPLFDVPVTIAASDRPLGTHVFTAEVDKTDSNALHWSVVSLPVAVRAAARDDDGHLMRRHRGAAVIPVAAKPVITPDSPAEALDRITIPADTMAKINEMLTTGGSVIVSDQGINQGETGEGTDFIVRLY